MITGSAVWMLGALSMDAVLMSLAPSWFGPGGRVQTAPLLLLMMSYSLLFSVSGGYVAGLVARRNEVSHAFALGLLQFCLGVAATVRFYDTAPLWYHVAFLALLVPANVFGRMLRDTRKQRLSRERLVAAAS